MELDGFILEFFGYLMTEEGIEEIKKIIKEDMLGCGYNYEDTTVNNYESIGIVRSEDGVKSLINMYKY